MHTGETPGWIHPLPARLHKPAFGLLVGALLLDFARAGLFPADRDHTPAGGPLPWAFAAGTLAVGLARRLPLQNVAFAGVSVLGLATGLELLNARTGLPFGPRQAAIGAGGEVLGMPWFTPLIWLCLTLCGRGLARLVLKPLRTATYYGLWVMGLAAAFVVLGWLALTPLASAAEWWQARLAPGVWQWHGLPWLGVPALAVAALLQLALATPWLLNKKPVRQPTDLHPLAVWTALLGWLLGRQAGLGLWFPAGLTLAVLLGTILAVLAGLRPPPPESVN